MNPPTRLPGIKSLEEVKQLLELMIGEFLSEHDREFLYLSEVRALEAIPWNFYGEP